MRSAGSMRRFAHRHDDLPAFHAAYLVLAVLSAALLNLGVFALMIVTHMALDAVKYRDVHGFGWKRTLEGMLRESLLDLTLLLTGLLFSVYLHHTLGLAGISGILRSELTVLRMLGTLLPKLVILHDVAKIALHFHTYITTPHRRMGKGWSTAERAMFMVMGASVLLLALAPSALHAPVDHVVRIVVQELTPGVH